MGRRTSRGVRGSSDLPAGGARRIWTGIAELAGVPVRHVSVGPDREQTLEFAVEREERAREGPGRGRRGRGSTRCARRWRATPPWTGARRAGERRASRRWPTLVHRVGRATSTGSGRVRRARVDRPHRGRARGAPGGRAGGRAARRAGSPVFGPTRGRGPDRGVEGVGRASCASATASPAPRSGGFTDAAERGRVPGPSSSRRSW